jgi:4-carboxymuconolactone decarboxylase
MNPQGPGRRTIGDITPKLAELTDDVLYADVWERPALSRRDRSLVTVAALLALYRDAELDLHLRLALDNGVTADELAEVATHLAFYAGWPCSVSAAHRLRHVLDDRLDPSPGNSPADSPSAPKP